MTSSSKTTTITPKSPPELKLGQKYTSSGHTVEVSGSNFPPNTDVVLRWQPGLGGATVRTDGEGSFDVVVLVLPNDVIGPRLLVWVADTNVSVEVVVSAGSVQPGDSQRRIRFGR